MGAARRSTRASSRPPGQVLPGGPAGMARWSGSGSPGQRECGLQSPPGASHGPRGPGSVSWSKGRGEAGHISRPTSQKVSGSGSGVWTSHQELKVAEGLHRERHGNIFILAASWRRMALGEGKSGSGGPGRRLLPRGEGGGGDERGGSRGRRLIDPTDPQEIESTEFSS